MNTPYRESCATCLELSAKNRSLSDSVDSLKSRLAAKPTPWFPSSESFGDYFWYISGFVLVAFASTIAYKSLASDGKIDYCFIDKDQYGAPVVYGHRNWRPDSTLTKTQTFEDADKIMQAHSMCKK